ncbi:helix-turn-helix transcriptional regulator [Leptolyngbya boryana CZ1]|uniref:Helix-turn-helix transcriptional regulator n=1 Tax=Leptolyngbya boryana CZ1 TaxID=3060204 RepID=A0AA96X1G8_LEPBY|nr:helix-turn-helix transcriptional regulator [Leptolyngbya boryana]WNZ49247.1 helix-turn-helix transcriptional regulator [Leptolyngbya boryana CZ1]
MSSEGIESTFVSLRKELGLTQEDIANELEVTPRTVINWENGHSEPRLSIRQVKKLCALFKRPIEQIPDDFFANKNTETLTN